MTKPTEPKDQTDKEGKRCMKNEEKTEELIKQAVLHLHTTTVHGFLYGDCPMCKDTEKAIRALLTTNTRETVERCQEAVRQEFKKKQNNEGSPKAKLHGEEIKAFLGIVWNDTHQALEKLKEEL